MCIICIKPYDVEDFSETIFKNSWARNDDGASYTYWNKEKQKWAVHKGIMKYEEFIDLYFKRKFSKEDYVIVHFRQGTSGGVKPENTHPFEICGDLEQMKQLQFESENLAFHNGTVIGGDKDYSDTMYYVRDYIFPLLPVWNDPKVNNNIAEAVLSKAGNSSRWVVCVGNKICKYGKWIKEDDGKLYSSDYYKGITTYSGNVIYSSWGAGSYTPASTSIPQQPWTHGYSAGEHGFWKDGKFTAWKDYYKERRSLQETIDITETDAEIVVDVLKDMKTQQQFDNRYKVNVGSSGGKFSVIMDWKLFARDIAAVVKIKKRSEKRAESEIWREPTETEKWAMGLNTYTPVSTPINKDTPSCFEDVMCPHCFEELHIQDSPFTVGDSLCMVCGCVFTQDTCEIHTYDQDIHTKFVASKM